MTLRINSGKSGPKAAPTPPDRASFVLGSRPPDLRAPRIKPMAASTTQYGKTQTGNPAGASYGNTGDTGYS
jgi:hypothetical protein